MSRRSRRRVSDRAHLQDGLSENLKPDVEQELNHGKHDDSSDIGEDEQPRAAPKLDGKAYAKQRQYRQHGARKKTELENQIFDRLSSPPRLVCFADAR